MREIKFRAFDEKTKKIYRIDSTHFVNGKMSFMFEHDELKTGKWDNNCFLLSDNPEVMQYTGLHDKNGKEIWEGDIIKLNANDYSQSEWGNYIVKFGGQKDNGSGYFVPVGWALERIEPKFPTLRPLEYMEKCYEIIGNIFENPKLLQKV